MTQPSPSPRSRLAILTYPLAPYRMELYDQVLRALGENWEGELVYGQSVQADHQWQKLFARPWRFGSELVPAAKPPEWCFKLLLKLGLMHHPFVLPGWAAARKVFQQLPTLLWVAEYSSYTIPSLLWARAKNIPVIVSTEMGRGMPRAEFSWAAEMKHRLMGRFVQGQVAASPWARLPCYAGIEKVVMSPHAIDTSRYVVAADRHVEIPVFLFVGNLIARKGLDLWFAACAQLRRECSVPFKVRLLGGGDQAWAQQQVAAHQLEEIVEFGGFKEADALISEYQRASAFVLPSRYDTYGAVAHEAAACGLPLILSRWAGSSEILVDEGKNGFRVDPTVPTELVAAMKTILTDSARRQQMGQRSREIAEQWSVQSCGAKVADLIRDLTG